MITKEIKERLKSWYSFKVESESPLTLVSTEDVDVRLVGLPAEMIVKEILNDIEEEARQSGDYSKLDSLNDDDILLVTAEVNYADEFDMSEFTTMTVKDFKEIVNILKDYDDEIEWYFGSNEELSFNDGKDLLSCLEFKVITQEESDVIDTLFDGSFGEAGVFEHIWGIGEEDEDEYDEDEEEESSFFSKHDIENIKKLEEKGWAIEVHSEEDYTVKYTHKDGVDFAIYDTSLIDDLISHYKRHKN